MSIIGERFIVRTTDRKAQLAAEVLEKHFKAEVYLRVQLKGTEAQGLTAIISSHCDPEAEKKLIRFYRDGYTKNRTEIEKLGIAVPDFAKHAARLIVVNRDMDEAWLIDELTRALAKTLGVKRPK